MFTRKHNTTDDAAEVRDAIVAARLARSASLRARESILLLVRMLQDRCPLCDDPVLQNRDRCYSVCASNRYPKGKGEREIEREGRMTRKGKERQTSSDRMNRMRRVVGSGRCYEQAPIGARAAGIDYARSNMAVARYVFQE